MLLTKEKVLIAYIGCSFSNAQLVYLIITAK